MNAKTKAKVQETIRNINEQVIAQMMAAEKNDYDAEVKLPEVNVNTTVMPKRSYNRLIETNNEAKNKKRRENRPSVLEQCILDGKHEEAREMICKKQYTTITSLMQPEEILCNEKTARKILKEMFKMIGYEVEMIPNAVKEETIKCVNNWLDYTESLYNYNKGKIIKPLDMKQDEMQCAYDTYILTKTIILLNSNSQTEYDENIAALNSRLKPVYAAIRALKET